MSSSTGLLPPRFHADRWVLPLWEFDWGINRETRDPWTLWWRVNSGR